MQFYFKNPLQDRLFFKTISTINLCYWIASDAHNYASEHTKDINKYEYDRLKSQYNLATNLFEESKNLSQFLEGDHAECANLVLRHISFTLQSYRIDKIFMPDAIDKEIHEVDVHDAIFDEEVFYQEYKKFLIPGDLETDFVESEMFFGESCIKMIKFLKNEYENHNDAVEDCRDIIDGVMSARLIMENGIKNNLYKESLEREYSIFYEDAWRPKPHSFHDYYETSMDYLDFWRDYYTVHEQHYKRFFDEIISEDESKAESDFFYQTIEQYTLIMHKKALEINLMILENLGVEVPPFEIYSARKITSPIDFLQHKMGSRVSK